MANKELPITLDEQVIQMKKYVSFRQRMKMRKFLDYAGYFRAGRYGKLLLSRVKVTGAKSKQDTLFALYNGKCSKIIINRLWRKIFLMKCRKNLETMERGRRTGKRVYSYDDVGYCKRIRRGENSSQLCVCIAIQL